MEQTRSLFFTCDSGEARCQSLLVNECSKRIARASELGQCQSNYVIHEAMNGSKNLKKIIKGLL